MTDQAQPDVTVIIPCRNEGMFIRACLESIANSDYPKDRLEVIIVDGMSDDGTRNTIIEFLRDRPWITLLDNHKKITSAALNLGIRNARGKVIMRMDAHVTYPSHYISCLVEWLKNTGADNVGGVIRTCPAMNTPLANAISLGLAHPFGVGTSYFRTGIIEPRWVDTVPFGCYRREVFERIGLFDEELVRNQDDEFNHRLLKQGGRILLVPGVVSQYFARGTLTKLAQMYWQYGYYKPLAVRKIGQLMTVRQLIPPAFILSLFTTACFGLWFWPMHLMLLFNIISYSALNLIFSIKATHQKGIRCGLCLALVFPVIHVSYGLGYLKGALDFLILRKASPRHLAEVPLTR